MSGEDRRREAGGGPGALGAVGAQAPGVPKARRFALAAGLALVVGALFGRAVSFDFVLWDDDLYVTAQPIVLEGLTWKGLVWAFTSEQASNWHPLTGLSHMLDVELFGTWAGGHHLTSVILHALNTALLFLVLGSLTGREWPSLVVAALFGVHPLHVESVAWVAERKDVLSGFFAIASIGAYGAYAARSRAGGGGAARYLLALILFALGLLSKPMLVTLPMVVLLLAVWPLGRVRERGWTRVVLELTPWFVLSAASSVVTLLVQRSSGAMDSSTIVPFASRVTNALVALLRYLQHTFWPADLAVLYPHPNLVGGTPLTSGAIVVAALVLVAVSAGVLVLRRGYLTVGWLWFVGMLVPVLGFVQVGSQAYADRYTYLPLVGLFVAVVFGVAELVERGRVPRGLAMGLGLAVPLACCVRTHAQLVVWRDSRTLFEHSLSIAPRAPILLHNLGNVLFAEELYDQAAERFREGLAIAPGYSELRIGLAVALREGGDAEAALEELDLVLGAHPDHKKALFESGWTHQRLEHANAATEAYLRLVELEPEHARAHYNLGLLAVDRGDLPQAVAFLEDAVRCDSAWIEPRNNLAWILGCTRDASVRNPQRALELARGSLTVTDEPSAVLFDTLAVASAACGLFDEALQASDEGMALAREADNPGLVDALSRRRALYAAGRPFVSSRL